MSILSDRLRLAIANKACKPSDITKSTGIDGSALSRYISGKYNPSADRIFVIAHFLGVSPEWLLGASESPKLVNRGQGIRVDKDKVIELQDKLIQAQSEIAEKDQKIAELVKHYDALTTEMQKLKEPARASAGHDKIRKKWKFESRDKRWEETMKEESTTKRPQKNQSKDSTLERMLKKRRG